MFCVFKARLFKVAVFILVVISLLAAFAKLRHDSIVSERKASIRVASESAYNIIAYYYGQESVGLPRVEAQRRALDEISRIRYGGDDARTEYLYVYRMDGVNLHHVRKELIGTNVAAMLRDANGNYPVKDLINALQDKKSAYVESMFPRENDWRPVVKLQYVMRFEPWDWFVGTGVWMDDVEKQCDMYYWILVFAFSFVGLCVSVVVVWKWVVSVSQTRLDSLNVDKSGGENA